MPGMPEMPGYVTEHVRLLTIYPPVASIVLVAALGGEGGGAYVMAQREVRVNGNGHIELWETRSRPKE